MRNFISLFLRNILKLIVLNVMFLIFGALIITIPVSYAALTKVLWKILEDDEDTENVTSVILLFWRAFKENFRQAMIYGMVVFIIGGGLVYAIWFYGNWKVAECGAVFGAMATVLLLAVAVSGKLAFIMLSVVSLPLKAVIKNSFLLIPVNPARILGSIVLECAILISSIIHLPYSLPIVCLIAVALGDFVGVYLLRPVIQKYICK